MPGAAHQGMAAVKTALEMLQKAVSQIPMGSPLHMKVLKFLADASKDLGEDSSVDQDSVKQQLAQMARQGPNAEAQGAMQRAFPPPQAGGGAQPPMAA